MQIPVNKLLLNLVLLALVLLGALLGSSAAVKPLSAQACNTFACNTDTHVCGSTGGYPIQCYNRAKYGCFSIDC
jgi:hypothetical protein